MLEQRGAQTVHPRTLGSGPDPDPARLHRGAGQAAEPPVDDEPLPEVDVPDDVPEEELDDVLDDEEELEEDELEVSDDVVVLRLSVR